MNEEEVIDRDIIRDMLRQSLLLSIKGNISKLCKNYNMDESKLMMYMKDDNYYNEEIFTKLKQHFYKSMRDRYEDVGSKDPTIINQYFSLDEQGEVEVNPFIKQMLFNMKSVYRVDASVVLGKVVVFSKESIEDDKFWNCTNKSDFKLIADNSLTKLK